MESRNQEMSQVRRKGEFRSGSIPRRPVVPRWIVSRLVGPGALYNFGNFLALSAGPALQLFQDWGQITIFAAVHQHLLASPEAIWLTTSLIMFVVSGEIYHRAYQARPEASLHMIQLGDVASGCAAILLTVALLLLGDLILALIAGGLLAGGKLGNAALPFFGVSNETSIGNALRLAAVASRAPSIATLTWAVAKGIEANAPWDSLVIPAIMILCFLLWLWADLLLMRKR